MLTHEEIATFMMQKRQHGTLAESLEAFKNLSTDTKTDLIRKGYSGHVARNAQAFGADAEDY
jgi:regulation of enolase protein 1 (concanavalin A-like superfamily)